MNSKKKEISKIIVAEFEINKLDNTYSDVASGELIAYFGSSGFLEIAINLGRADEIIPSTSSIRLVFK